MKNISYLSTIKPLNLNVFSGNVSRLLALALLVVATAGCGTSASKGSIPADQRNFEVDYDYVIGPGDAMEIFVWGNPDLSSTVQVRPDGKITTRLVENIEASGKTPSELARDIEKVYSEYVREPVVSVIVDRFVGVPSQQVRVVGEAVEPSKIPYSKHMTLLDLMVAVGGLTEFAAGNKAVLIRSHDQASRKVYNLRLEDLLKDGDISADVSLFPGDIILIPEAWF